MKSQRPEWFELMLDPAFYPHRPQDVEMVETHISWVFLAGEFVYKVKKPVDFGFLNYTTLELRHHYCQEELRLNRRLCPEIYLAVVPICRQGQGSYNLKGQGEPVEWAVEMKRMPDEGRMDRMIEADLVEEADIRSLSELLIPFYKGAVCSRQKAEEFGGLDTVRENCLENFQQTEEFIGTLIDRQTFDSIKEYTIGFMEGHADLFTQRQEAGKIVEGHGDLYSANICIDRKHEKIYVFDCIEFNERFRYGDQACDIAFLLMDLDFLGLSDLSLLMFDLYRDGLREEKTDELMEFYKCYRAYVRGKIACFTWASLPSESQTGSQGPASQGKDSPRRLQEGLAKRYFRLALKYTGALSRPVLYVFMGLTGTGKSTIAKAFSKAHQLAYFNSDVVRKELIAGLKKTDSRLEPYGKGIYSPEFTKRTYRALSRLAGRRLVLGESVVVDATFTSRELRQQAERLAVGAGADIVFIHCTCPEELVRQRFEKRFSEDGRVSDGRMEIYLEQKRAFTPPEISPEAGSHGRVVTLDTTGTVDEVLERLEGLLSR